MIRVLFVGLILLGLVACATPRPLTVGPMAWTESGLINWRHAENSLTVEFQIGSDANKNLLLEVSKSERLLTLVRAGELWSATGPMVGPGWTGAPDSAPLRLAGWISLAETLEYIRQAPPTVDAVVSGRVRARWSTNEAEIITTETADQFRVIWK